MPQIEHDHYPEIVENGQGTRRLELLGVSEQFRNPQERRQFFANLSDDNYTQMISYVNSITQGKTISHDYADGRLPLLETPPLEDKQPLMELAFKSVREIASDPNLDDKTALRRAGLTLAGAINYIHPKENGNGRTGRVSHYLVEFGTERGDKAVNEELYAVIGKLPMYNTDKFKALHDTPPIKLERALDLQVAQSSPADYARLSVRERASARVVAFLDMMRGETTVPIAEATRLPNGTGADADGKYHFERFEPNQLTGIELYERQYLAYSTIPNRLPEEVPLGAQRVMAEKPTNAPKASVFDMSDVVA